jgi:hypothetical protein
MAKEMIISISPTVMVMTAIEDTVELKDPFFALLILFDMK